jgi:hypothetical protein
MTDCAYSGSSHEAEYSYDPESWNWCFVVPSLGIVGGARTRELAEEDAIRAITFTIESENESVPPTDGEVRYLQVTLQAP